MTMLTDGWGPMERLQSANSGDRTEGTGTAATVPSVLFVDDERPVLDGLRRRLKGQETCWRMLFAQSGGAALDIMAEQAVDVIVTDMKMPGMDGAALLDRVRTLYPGAARIILSGFAEREAIFRTLGPAHQYFSKPCNTTTLVGAIERSLWVRSRLNSPDLLALVAGANCLPAMPHALSELFAHLQSPNGSAAEAARIIGRDIGLTTQLLKYTNSAYFCPRSSVSDVLSAVRLLGFDLLRSLVVLAGVFESFRDANIDLDVIKRLQDRSLMIGALARRIAGHEGLSPILVEQSHCAGMLAHVGFLMLFANWPDKVARLQRDLDGSGGEITSSERRIFNGGGHPELGGALLGLWGFSDPVVEAVLLHHRPGLGEFCDAAGMSPVAAVHAAQHLVKPVPAGTPPEDSWAAGLDMAYLARIGMVDHVADWARHAADVRRESGQ